MVKRVTGRLALRTRLTLWVIGVAAVIQLAVGLVYYLYQRQSIERFFDDHIKTRSDGIVRDLADRLPGLTIRELNEIATNQKQYSMFSGFLLSVYREDGSLVITNRAEPPRVVRTQDMARVALKQSIETLVGPATEVKRFDADATRGRAIIRGFVGADGRRYGLLVATPDTAAQQMLRTVTTSILIGFPSGVLVAAFTGWFIAGVAVSPLERVRKVAATLTPESIGQAREAPGKSSPEQERLENELNLAMERLGKAFAAQERFMSNVSHELKTPIAVLLTEAQTIDLAHAPEDVVNHVRGTAEELRRLGSLVDSFLLLTRVREGRSPVHARSLGVNDLVMDSLSHCHLTAAERGVRLEPKLHETDDPDRVSGDPTLLVTMIENLMRNAIRFSPAGGTVGVATWCTGGMVGIAVTDSGPGIPEALIDRIFDRFVQAPDEARRGRGQGLGLEIAQGIAELHGGRITARNRIGDGGRVIGCELEVRLPATKPETP